MSWKYKTTKNHGHYYWKKIISHVEALKYMNANDNVFPLLGGNRNVINDRYDYLEIGPLRREQRELKNLMVSKQNNFRLDWYIVSTH